MMRIGRFILLAAALGLACAAPADAQFTWSVQRAAQLAGEQIYKDHCIACHRLGKGVEFGPSLAGIVGRKAGALPNFPYSGALKDSGLVWTEDNLRKWISDGAALVPNTLMPHVSIKDPAEQFYLITYLKTLKAPAAR